MERQIVVKGVGTATTSPDQVTVSLSVSSRKRDYEETLNENATLIEALNQSLKQIGFDKKAVKTTNFTVQTEYDQSRDRNGNFQRVFVGYRCTHQLKISFDFSNEKLGKTLAAISQSIADPELSIRFTIKDPSDIKKDLLRSAADNAREKAELLCEASNVKLGKLLSIDYDWNEINVYSRTGFEMEDRCLTMAPKAIANMEIEPDDINVSDTVTFVWEIQ